MSDRYGIVRLTLTVIVAGCLVALALAAETGQIKGKITDKETGQPIIGASVQIMGTHRGAQTDLDGIYEIFRIDPGTYELKVSSVNYQTKSVEGVVVVADSTTEVNVAMDSSTSKLDEEITIVGTRDIVDKFEVSSQTNLGKEAIEAKPASGVDELIRQVAGVQTTSNGETFIRGGRAGEVSYIVDGVPIGDPMAGTSFGPAHGGTAIVNDKPYDAMFFEHYGTNPFVDTDDDSLSTFAVDVDDASFIMTRAYLEGGHLPEKEAVRVEEFVNHFDYEYASPTEGEGFAIHVDGARSRFGTANVRLLRIGIKGKDVTPVERKAANLVFVVDVSGSMGSGNRLGLVRKALNLLLEQLREDDRVGIVVYASRARVVLEPTSIAERAKIKAAIDRLRSQGSTYAEEGIRLGYEMADSAFEPGKINRIILCSDGVANVGATGPDELLKMIRKYAKKGITLSTVGFGMGNYNDVLMEKLGNKGDGQYAYVDDLPEARRVFVENLTGTLQVIGRDVKVQVEFDPAAVRSYRLLGYENRDVPDDKFRDDDEDGGEIGSGHTVTALYELKLRDDTEAERLGAIYVRYRLPEGTSTIEQNVPINVANLATSFEQASTDFRTAAAAAEFAEILRESYWAKKSSLADVLEVTKQLFLESDDTDVLELHRLVTRANDLQKALAAAEEEE